VVAQDPASGAVPAARLARPATMLTSLPAVAAAFWALAAAIPAGALLLLGNGACAGDAVCGTRDVRAVRAALAAAALLAGGAAVVAGLVQRRLQHGALAGGVRRLAVCLGLALAGLVAAAVGLDVASVAANTPATDVAASGSQFALGELTADAVTGVAEMVFLAYAVALAAGVVAAARAVHRLRALG